MHVSMIYSRFNKIYCQNILIIFLQTYICSPKLLKFHVFRWPPKFFVYWFFFPWAPSPSLVMDELPKEPNSKQAMKKRFVPPLVGSVLVAPPPIGGAFAILELDIVALSKKLNEFIRCISSNTYFLILYLHRCCRIEVGCMSRAFAIWHPMFQKP
jgi:hypothetical protein